jgi:hypothetical protein
MLFFIYSRKGSCGLVLNWHRDLLQLPNIPVELENQSFAYAIQMKGMVF